MYVTFVGKPGLGKGQVIRCVSEILNTHTLESYIPKAATPDMQAVMNATQVIDLKEAKEENDKEPPKMFVVAADCVTYEALVQSMGRCVRRVNYKFLNPETQKEEPKVYSHSSLCFCLEELESLLREKTQSLRTFLIQAYDCGDNYEYRTKTSGTDRVRKLCLNFLAGTNPDFMRSTFDDRLLSSGYSSRTFFVYAAKNRKSVFFLPELTLEQACARDEVSAHVKSLYQLYGQVNLAEGTQKFLEHWIGEHETKPETRASQSPKLDAYYARKNIHVMKLAMAMHFGESLDMTIPIETFQKAITYLAEEEKTMHFALTMDSKNPLADPSKKVSLYLKSNGKKKFNELLTEFWETINKIELQTVLETLEQLGEVSATVEECAIEKANRMFYKSILKD